MLQLPSSFQAPSRKTRQKYLVRGVGILSGVGFDGDDDHDDEEDDREDYDGDDDVIEDDDDDGDDGDDDGEHGQNIL